MQNDAREIYSASGALVYNVGDTAMKPKPRIKKYGCFWIVLTLQTSGHWKGEWTYSRCHETLEEALKFTARKVLGARS